MLIVLSALLSGCAVPAITLFDRDNPGSALTVGESSNVHFFTNESNFDTGINLVEGVSYDLISLS